MKPFVRRSLLMFAILCLTVLPTCAQQEAPEQEVAFVWEVQVNPDRVVQYDEAVKKLVSIAEGAKLAYPWEAMVRNDFLYYFVIPIEDLADLEKFSLAFQRMMAKDGQEMPSLQEGNSQYGQGSVWIHRADLSYIPDPPVGDPEKQLYRFWQFFYGKPGHEAQIEEIIKEFAALHEKHGGLLPWGIYEGFIGTDNPVYLVAYYAENGVALHTADLENQKKFGDEMMKLFGMAFQHTRDLETFDGWYRPDLSYTPE